MSAMIDEDMDDGAQAQQTEEAVVEHVNRMLAAFVDGTVFDPRQVEDEK